MRSLVRWKRPLHGLGVDFGSSGVKAVALSSDGGEVTLLGAEREALEPGAVQDGAVRDPDAVGGALGRLLVRLGSRSRRLALAIGGSSVLIKRFPAPSDAIDFGDGAGELRDAVAREAARHVPCHLESLEFDYEGPLPAPQPVPLPAPPSAPPQGAPGIAAASGPGTIVFGAAPREIVQGHCRAAAAAGREVTRIELEPYALYRAAGLTSSIAAPKGEPRALAIVEIGASRAGVHVFGNSPAPCLVPRRTGKAGESGRAASAPADLLVSVPAPGAGALAMVRPPESGASRFEPGGRRESLESDWQGERGQDADVVANRIVATLREALREAGPCPPVQLCLSGGGAAFPGLRTRLGELDMGDPTILDPLGFVGSRGGEPAFSVAAGLAYQAILDLSRLRTGRRI